jgi:hypothetical protein
MVKNAIIANNEIKQYIIKSPIFHFCSQQERKRMVEILDLCLNRDILQKILDIKMNKKNFIKILVKLSDDSFYFKDFTINYTWILFYFEDYNYINSKDYINKIQIDYIENNILPLFNYLLTNHILGLTEYHKNIINNINLWKIKYITIKQLFNGI